MRDEKVYHEYANWKMEHHDLLKYLIERNSDLMIRFKHVIDVIDYLYDKLIDDPTYSEEEDQIFETGFYYMVDQIEEIDQLLKKTYQNNLEDLDKKSKDVNLLLTTIDFQNELLGLETFDDKDMNVLVSFEEKVKKLLEDKKEIPKEMYEELDQLSYELFKKLDVEYYPINHIFLEIADELGIL